MGRSEKMEERLRRAGSIQVYVDTKLVSSRSGAIIASDGDQVPTFIGIQTFASFPASVTRGSRADAARVGQTHQKAAKLDLQLRDGQSARRRDGVCGVGEGLWRRSRGGVLSVSELSVKQSVTWFCLTGGCGAFAHKNAQKRRTTQPEYRQSIMPIGGNCLAH